MRRWGESRVGVTCHTVTGLCRNRQTPGWPNAAPHQHYVELWWRLLWVEVIVTQFLEELKQKPPPACLFLGFQNNLLQVSNVRAPRRGRLAQLISLKSQDFRVTTHSASSITAETLGSLITIHTCLYFPHAPVGAKTRRPGGGAVTGRGQVREMHQVVASKSTARKSCK